MSSPPSHEWAAGMRSSNGTKLIVRRLGVLSYWWSDAHENADLKQVHPALRINIGAKRREMKILISSHLFAPSVGGIELVGAMLAEEFTRAGHQVRVITQTLAKNEEPAPYEVYRGVSKPILFGLLRWCDVFLQNNISLDTLWPALLLGTPTLIVYQTWIARPDGKRGWRERLKLLATKLVDRNAAISRAVADTVPARCGILANPYCDEVFKAIPGAIRDRDMIFVGRLVSDKGVDILLSALGRLAEAGKRPSTTIIGSGPEEALLKDQCARLGLGSSVEFVGTRTGHELCALLNRHRVMIVPSLSNEPFGIVALEGIASGCVLIGSQGGGLPDAMGRCGVTFPNGDVSALAERIDRLLADEALRARLREPAADHLAKHRQAAVAGVYLRELSALCGAC
jgi:glycogen synthase